MVPLCPQCQKAIERSDVSLAQAMVYCKACGQYFKLAEHLLTPELVERIDKPANSTITIEEHDGYSTVIIPRKGWDLRLVVPLFFLCLLILFQMPAPGHAWFMWLVLGLVLILIPLIWIVPFFSCIRVLVGPVMSVQWSLLGLAWTKRRPVADLVRITEHPVRTSENNEQLGVGLFFDDGYRIAFGSMLEDTERKWLIGELRQLVTRQLAKDKREASSGASGARQGSGRHTGQA